MHARVSVCIAVLLVALICVATVANATSPGRNGKIAFSSLKNGSPDVFIANINGKKRTNLTKTLPSSQFNPSWSPDGRSLIFESVKGSNANGIVFKLYIHELTKRQLRNATANKKPARRQLTKGKGSDTAGQFCGRNVIFVRKLGKRRGDLYMVGTNGKGLRRLTKTAGAGGSPTCTAEGLWVYYTKESPPGSFQLDVVRQRLHKNGKTLLGKPEVLVPGSAFDISPDGRTLAYSASDPVDFNTEIFLLNLAQDGAVPGQVTDTARGTSNFAPRFTPSFGLPDARRLASVDVAILVWREQETRRDGTIKTRWFFGDGGDFEDYLERLADDNIDDLLFESFSTRENDAEFRVAPLPPVGVQSYAYSEWAEGRRRATKWWLTGTAAKDKWRVVLSSDQTKVTVFIGGKKKYESEVDFSDGLDFSICFRALNDTGELRFEGFEDFPPRFEISRSGPIVSMRRRSVR